MPVHKVKGGYRWGERGKVYPDAASAERQARAAHAHGYEGKAFDPMEAVMELAGGVYGDKTYVSRDEIRSVPGDRSVYQGPHGGFFYFHEGDKPAPEGTRVVRASTEGGPPPVAKPRAEAAGAPPGAKKTASEVLGLFVSDRDAALDANGIRLTVKQGAWLQRTIDQALRGGKTVDNGGLQSRDGSVTQYADGTRVRTASGDSFVVRNQGDGVMSVRRESKAARPVAQGAPGEIDTAAERFKVPNEVEAGVREIASAYEPVQGYSGGANVEQVINGARSNPKFGRKVSDFITGAGGMSSGGDYLDGLRYRQARQKQLSRIIIDELGKKGISLMNNSYSSSLVDLAEEVSGMIAKAAPHRDPTTFSRKKTKEEYFATHEDDAGVRAPLPKERYYLKEGEEPPQSVFVQEGPRGGRYYEMPARGKSKVATAVEEGAGSMGNVVEQPSANPRRVVKPTPSTSQTMEVRIPFESTIAKIRGVLAAAKVRPARKLPNGRSTPGYEIETRDDHFEVYGRGRSDEETRQVARAVNDALYNSGLDVSSEEDHAVVEALAGDPLDELFGDGGIDTELDPLLSEKAWSHDEAILASGLIAKGVMPSVVVAALSAKRVVA